MENNNSDIEINLITKCIAHAVCTQNSNWNNEEFKSGVIENYRKLESLSLKIQERQTAPTLEEMELGLFLLNKIFITKKINEEERYRRFKRILEETNEGMQLANFIENLI